MGSKIHRILYFVLGENKATQDGIICSNSRGKIKITPDSHPGFQPMTSFLVPSSIKTWAFSVQVSILHFSVSTSPLFSQFPTPKKRGNTREIVYLKEHVFWRLNLILRNIGSYVHLLRENTIATQSDNINIKTYLVLIFKLPAVY